MRNIIQDGVKLMPGVSQLLSFFQQKGYKQAVVSQSPQWLVELVLKSAGIYDCFDLVVGGDSVPFARRKPEPDLYQLAAWNLTVPIYRCLAFEDTLIGANAAARAGAYTIMVPSHYNQRERSRVGPTLYGTLTNLDGLVHIIKRATPTV